MRTRGKPRPDSVIEMKKSVSRINDPCLFTVDEVTFKAFAKLLDEPLPVTKELSRLMNAKAPWES